MRTDNSPACSWKRRKQPWAWTSATNQHPLFHASQSFPLSFLFVLSLSSFSACLYQSESEYWSLLTFLVLSWPGPATTIRLLAFFFAPQRTHGHPPRVHKSSHTFPVLDPFFPTGKAPNPAYRDPRACLGLHSFSCHPHSAQLPPFHHKIVEIFCTHAP